MNKNLNEQEKAALVLASAIEKTGRKQAIAEKPKVRSLAELLVAESAAANTETTEQGKQFAPRTTVELPKVITGRVSAAVFQKLRQVEE
jgi:hypothetical protein